MFTGAVKDTHDPSTLDLIEWSWTKFGTSATMCFVPTCSFGSLQESSQHDSSQIDFRRFPMVLTSVKCPTVSRSRCWKRRIGCWPKWIAKWDNLRHPWRREWTGSFLENCASGWRFFLYRSRPSCEVETESSCTRNCLFCQFGIELSSWISFIRVERFELITYDNGFGMGQSRTELVDEDVTLAPNKEVVVE